MKIIFVDPIKHDKRDLDLIWQTVRSFLGRESGVVNKNVAHLMEAIGHVIIAFYAVGEVNNIFGIST